MLVFYEFPFYHEFKSLILIALLTSNIHQNRSVLLEKSAKANTFSPLYIIGRKMENTHQHRPFCVFCFFIVILYILRKYMLSTLIHEAS